MLCCSAMWWAKPNEPIILKIKKHMISGGITTAINFGAEAPTTYRGKYQASTVFFNTNSKSCMASHRAVRFYAECMYAFLDSWEKWIATQKIWTVLWNWQFVPKEYWFVPYKLKELHCFSLRCAILYRMYDFQNSCEKWISA